MAAQGGTWGLKEVEKEALLEEGVVREFWQSLALLGEYREGVVGRIKIHERGREGQESKSGSGKQGRG